MDLEKRNIMGHLDPAVKLGEIMAKSKMFGITSPEQGVILALTCASENITPIEFMRKYHIIEGKPTMRADAMLAEFCKAGGVHIIKSYTNKEVSIEFDWRGHKSDWSWTIDDAKRAGLAGRNIWQKYPKAMLFARCVSEALKRICPELFHGLYVPEEIEDLQPEYTIKPTAPGNGALSPHDAKQIQEGANTPAKALPSSASTIDFSILPQTMTLKSVSGREKEYRVGTPWADIDSDFLEKALLDAKRDEYREAIKDALKLRLQRRKERDAKQYAEDADGLSLDEIAKKLKHPRLGMEKRAALLELAAPIVLENVEKEGISDEALNFWLVQTSGVNPEKASEDTCVLYDLLTQMVKENHDD